MKVIEVISKKISSSCFYVFIWIFRCVHLKFGLAKAKGHKKKIVKSIKKFFIGVKNYDIKEHFLLKELISTIIYYPSIDS